MGQEDLQKRITNAVYGNPLLHPEEQHKYMGTFRERCYLTMTIAQMKNNHNKELLITELEKHPTAFVLLNGSIDFALQSSYIKLLTTQKIAFTVINDFVENKPESFGLIIAGKTAVNEVCVDIEEKYAGKKIEQKLGKKNFWQKLF